MHKGATAVLEDIKK